ncbi:SGNH/GDSL hydrolase family protein [Labilibacter marinus]|uniref:hypothetical protein n=1 Tax=Labilibacter marinus TaxID=1477105 RepID=UPI00082C6605|nr:hypothetical protein [Labilibacter marinus]
MIKPPKIFLYFLIIFFALGTLSYFIPAVGWKLGDTGLTFRWISLEQILKREQQAADSLLVASIDSVRIDSITIEGLPLVDSLAQDTLVVDSISSIPQLKYPEEFREMLYGFYQKVSTAKDSNKIIRILHMGDSQIEGDRISKYLRERFQQKFHGSGPGLVPLYDPQKQFPSVWIKNEGAWSEHVVYNYPRLIQDNQYGIMGKVSKIDSVGESTVFIERSGLAMPKATRFYKTRLFLKSIQEPLTINAYWGRDLISTDSLAVDENITEVNWTFEEAPKKFSLSFESKESPLFLGLSLDSVSGVALDNISMRGQSSPRLDKTNQELYQSMAEYMNIGMVVLQYGTNMVPTVTEEYDFYRITFYRQLEILKRTMPGVPVVVVGVGDVAKLSAGKVESYHHIVKIKEAQKQAAFKAGFAFFDLFEVMGGEGSMITWVNGDPKLAMSDYTHFNKPGGKKVAQWIFDAIMSEFNNYQEAEKDSIIVKSQK